MLDFAAIDFETANGQQRACGLQEMFCKHLKILMI